VYGAMNPLLAYTLAPMPLPAFHIPRASGKTTWEPVSTSTSTAAPCFHAEISGFEPPGTPQIKRSRLSSSSWSARRQIEFLVDAKFNQFPVTNPGMGGWEKSLLPLKGTTLHRTTFLSVGSKREDLQSMLEIFLGRKIDAETSICGVEPLLLARSLNWSSRAVCSCLVAHAHHSQQTSATYARSSAGPRIHYLDAPQTQPSSARLQRQQAGRGRLKPGVRQNCVTTAPGARVDS
ncbi:hypothetical protein THAOC_29202, partial [Thalassiosira oceanica]